ncbi:MAG: cob(I)yrinic acid a,c-diamide adenosyltransferase [Planctomycetes bacterium]|nr:cob(I)yrinic acid a,c-diamide adenosyltransferase [Planctomycetota bacterium]
MRITKVYTRTGDSGTTGLGDGSRTKKDAARIEAYGTVDELSSQLGLARAELDALPDDPLAKNLADHLGFIQNELFTLGGDLAVPLTSRPEGMPSTTVAMVTGLEELIDHLNAGLPPLTNFILPGGHRAACALQIARTVCRRAERCVATLQDLEPIGPAELPYLNRLSDLLFVLARVVARHLDGTEELWDRSRVRPALP